VSLAPQPGGVAKLGVLAAILLTAGNMIGSGVYLLPATLGAYGSITILSWAIASSGALVLALVFGLLGVLRPTGDGVVAYAGQDLHPALGHVSWFAYWLNCWVGTTAIAVAAVGYLAYFIPALAAPGPALAAVLASIWLFTLANLVGPRLVARIGGATLLLGLAPIILAMGIGILAFDPSLFQASWNVSGKPDAAAMSLAVTPVFWAFLGLESANVAARVIDNPRRNLPIVAVGGVLLAAAVYMAASVAIMGLMPAKALAASTAPFADAIAHIAGPLAAGLVAFCAFTKASGSLGGWVLLTAETGRAGAQSGYLPKFATDAPEAPRRTRDILVAGVLMSLASWGSMSPTLGKQFSLLINLSVMLSMVLYLLCALSLCRAARDQATTRSRLATLAVGLAGAGFTLWVMATADPTLRGPTVIAVGISLGLWGVSRLRASGA
jgi:arginine:agmatine antiporter